jgi:hypothetical protein
MNEKTIILLSNFIVLLIITIYTRYGHGHLDIILNAFGVAILIATNLVIALFFYINNNELAKTFFLNSGITLLIGFSSCFAIEYLR